MVNPFLLQKLRIGEPRKNKINLLDSRIDLKRDISASGIRGKGIVVSTLK